MNLTPQTSTSTRSTAHHAGVAIFFFAMVLAAVSNGSFWIDECGTARFACHAGFAEMWRDVLASKFADVQLPLYITYVWAFEKIFGHGEFAMRLSALPFFVGGMTLLTMALTRRTGRLWPAITAIGLSPFAWYYLNEARPYAIQMGITATIVAALIRLSEPSATVSRTEESRWLAIYLIGVVLLSGLSMLGQLWAGAALLAVFVVVPRTRWVGWWETKRRPLLLTAAALLLVGVYYLWSLTIGARATVVGSTNLQTVLFIFYEHLGFVGPGPGRVALRVAGIAALKPFAPALAGYGAVVGLVLGAGLAALWQKPVRRLTLGILACLALPAGLILLAGLVTHFRVLGRHFAPLAVILLVILSVGLLQLWQGRRGIGKVLVTGFVAVTLASCLLVRLASRHEKDNYRQAAVVAREALARNEIVWWNGDSMAADYYAVPLTTNATAGHVRLISGPPPGFAEHLPKPDTVIASKPDIYDGQGALAEYLKANGYRPVTNFIAFLVWRQQ